MYAVMVPLRRESISSPSFITLVIFDASLGWHKLLIPADFIGIWSLGLSMFSSDSTQEDLPSFSGSWTADCRCFFLTLVWNFLRSKEQTSRVRCIAEFFFRVWLWYFCNKTVNIIAISFCRPIWHKKAKIINWDRDKGTRKLYLELGFLWHMNDLTVEECDSLPQTTVTIVRLLPFTTVTGHFIYLLINKKSELQCNASILKTIITTQSF